MDDQTPIQLDLFDHNTPHHGVRAVTPFGEKMVFGGSFFNAPDEDGWLTINLMAEHQLPCNIHIPIKDFAVPSSPIPLIQAFELMLQTDQNIYAGCMAGRGRTGLFMACWLKYLGHPDPITEVRRQYNPHAVETKDQAGYVAWFPTRDAVMRKKQEIQQSPSSSPKL